MTTFIRTPDRETLLTALRSANLVTTDEDGNEVIQTSSHAHFIDVIGTITRTITPAEFDEEGSVTKDAEEETLEGYHANWAGKLPDELKEFVISKPNKPSRIIAGDG